MQLDERYRQIVARFLDIGWEGDCDVAPANFVQLIGRLPVTFTPGGKG